MGFEINCSQVDVTELHVYNRWGNEVYRDMNYKNDWTGTYQDKPLPDGTYFLMINITDRLGNQISYAGDLTILR